MVFKTVEFGHIPCYLIREDKAQNPFKKLDIESEMFAKACR